MSVQKGERLITTLLSSWLFLFICTYYVLRPIRRGLVLDGLGNDAMPFIYMGTALITGGADKSVRLWTVADGKQVAQLEGSEGAVGAVAITPDGARPFGVREETINVASHGRPVSRDPMEAGEGRCPFRHLSSGTRRATHL